MDNTVKNNGIKTYKEDIPSPRAQTPPPRAQKDPRLIVASSVVSNAACPKKANSTIIMQSESDAPANNTRARKSIVRTIPQEAVLSAMELSQARVSAKSAASRKYPLQLLCDWANTVMDANGELLQYRHLIKRDEYRDTPPPIRTPPPK